jgi:ABC-type phosphate/phosphonate transport system substrate-binding protein
MTILKELIEILYRNPNPPLQSWVAANLNSRIVQLYYGIARQQWKTDMAASLALYGKTDSAAYRKIKSDLKNKLLQFIVFTNIDEEENAQARKIKALEYQLLIEKLNYFEAEEVLKSLEGLEKMSEEVLYLQP